MSCVLVHAHHPDLLAAVVDAKRMHAFAHGIGVDLDATRAGAQRHREQLLEVGRPLRDLVRGEREPVGGQLRREPIVSRPHDLVGERHAVALDLDARQHAMRVGRDPGAGVGRVGRACEGIHLLEEPGAIRRYDPSRQLGAGVRGSHETNGSVLALETRQAIAVQHHVQGDRTCRDGLRHVERAIRRPSGASAEQAGGATGQTRILPERQDDPVVRTVARMFAHADRHPELVALDHHPRGDAELDVDSFCRRAATVRRPGDRVARNLRAGVGLVDPLRAQLVDRGDVTALDRAAEPGRELLRGDHPGLGVWTAPNSRTLAHQIGRGPVHRDVLTRPCARRRTTPHEHAFAVTELRGEIRVVAGKYEALRAERSEISIRDRLEGPPVRGTHTARILVAVTVDPALAVLALDAHPPGLVGVPPRVEARSSSVFELDRFSAIGRGLTLEAANHRRIAECAARRVARVIRGVLAGPDSRHRLCVGVLPRGQGSTVRHRPIMSEQDELAVGISREPLLEASIAMHDAAEAVADVDHARREVGVGLDDSPNVLLEHRAERSRGLCIALRVGDPRGGHVFVRVSRATRARALSDRDLSAPERHRPASRRHISMLDDDLDVHARRVGERGCDLLGVADPELRPGILLLETRQAKLDLDEAPVAKHRTIRSEPAAAHVDLLGGGPHDGKAARVFAQASPEAGFLFT